MEKIARNPINVNDQEQEREFIPVHRDLVENPKYKDLTPAAKLAYSLFRNRLKLSKLNKDKYSDKNGNLFILFSNEELAEYIKTKPRTAGSKKQELENVGLIKMQVVGNNMPNKIYIYEPESCEKSEYISTKFREKKQQEKEKNVLYLGLLTEKTEKKKQQEEVPASAEQKQEKEAGSVEPVGECKNYTSGSAKSASPEVQKITPIKKEGIKKDIKKKDIKKDPKEADNDIYSALWNSCLSKKLTKEISILLNNKSIKLSIKQLQEIEKAYNYQLEINNVNPDISPADPSSLNDLEFADTVCKMLVKEKHIKRMEGLINSWVQRKLGYKADDAKKAAENQENSRKLVTGSKKSNDPDWFKDREAKDAAYQPTKLTAKEEAEMLALKKKYAKTS